MGEAGRNWLDGMAVGPMAERARAHKGDIMSAEKRSALMSRIRGKNTGCERSLAAGLRACGLRPARHVRGLPGTPDFVFRRLKVAVFVDGDFWHGWHFSKWRLKLSEKWEAKIAANMRRDKAAHQALRRDGWIVVRIWEHQLHRDRPKCVTRVLDAIVVARRRIA